MFDFLKIMLEGQKAKLDERGASAVEYGLLVAAIAAVIIIVIFALGGKVQDLFSSTCDSFAQHASSGGTCAK
jgi:pilus assembly protein Flp/PilA